MPVVRCNRHSIKNSNVFCSLVMGTRSGDMDPAVPLFLMNTLGCSARDMDTILNKKSGLLGVSGHSDLRSIIENKVGRIADFVLFL